MVKGNNVLKPREIQVYIELLKDGRAPDKRIAQKIGTTQPTVTRIRQKLEQAGFIKRYKAVADYAKAGVGIIVTTFFTWMDYTATDHREKFRDYLKKRPEVMLFSRGEGIEGRTNIIISGHKDFRDYEGFIREIRKAGGPNFARVTQFISSPGGGFIKQYDSTEAVVNILQNRGGVEVGN